MKKITKHKETPITWETLGVILLGFFLVVVLMFIGWYIFSFLFNSSITTDDWAISYCKKQGTGDLVTSGDGTSKLTIQCLQ